MGKKKQKLTYLFRKKSRPIDQGNFVIYLRDKPSIFDSQKKEENFLIFLFLYLIFISRQ